MGAPAIVVFIALVSASSCAEDLVFPKTLKFGVATASYQVEGAWNVSDKGPHIWDNYARIPGKVADGNTGDVACDSYHKWERDIEMVSELGADYYRFSISWPRILPTGFTNQISEDGKNYYNNLIDGLLEKGIQPMVTMYHWELPQHFQDLGGWANPLISNWFADYARVLFKLFGDRVKIWLTINEPIAVCEGSYSLGLLAPGIRSPDEIGSFLCNKNILIAHAKAWRIYDQEFRSKYQGEVSICNNLIWYEEATPEDAELTELARQINGGRYSHPIFSKEGGWPQAIEKIIAENSARQGYRGSRLPPFTPEELELVRGSYDFYAFNYYTSLTVARKDEGAKYFFPFTGSDDLGAKFTKDPSWKVACNHWLAIYPSGLRKVLAWIKKEYGDLKILITENGYPSCGEELDHLDDQDRIDYYKQHLEEVQKSMTIDGVNIAAFTFWSLMDNFEWMDGYKTKFGLYAVNFSDPERTRTPRKSAEFFTKLVKSRKDVTAESSVKYNSDLYMWYSFGAVLVFVVIVSLFEYVKRRNTEEKIVDNITPLIHVEEVQT